jgi:hypothetical protein
VITQPIVHYITTKQPPTCSNYGKIGHAKEIYCKRKREELVVLIVPTKIIELVIEVISQPIKLARIPLRYLCIICFSSQYYAFDCPKNIEVYNMF